MKEDGVDVPIALAMAANDALFARIVARWLESRR